MSRYGIDSHLRDRLLMRYRLIDGQTFGRMVGAGLVWLRTNQEIVNSLNVFPVPDGDTGTNMVLTMQSAVDEIADPTENSIGKVAQLVAHGALMGARGNSGVILSQLWRGFSRVLGDREKMDAATFAAAFKEARATAYKGVVKPVEGTILTVSTDVAQAAEMALSNGVTSALEVLEAVVQAAEDSVERTPELLPVLKEAGVVDSGGKGLFYILEGALRATYRQPLDTPETTVMPLISLDLEDSLESIEPGQDWEVVIDFRPTSELDLNTFTTRLDEMGTSIQIGEGDGIYRMHIHVPDETEYEPIDYVRSVGTITKVAMENLMDQMATSQLEAAPTDVKLQPFEPDTIAVVAVAPGYGFARVFASLGVAAIVPGGQTMNPSTQEILDAFEDLPTNTVVILPNNKNIILAAEQAAKVSKKEVFVIPCVSVPQGIAAMFAYDPNGEIEEVVEAMKSSYTDLNWAEITTATRSVEIDGVQVEEGQVIGILNGKLACSGQDLGEVLMATLEKATIPGTELITLFRGKDLDEDEIAGLTELISSSYPDYEIEVHEGSQPHYQLILSIE